MSKKILVVTHSNDLSGANKSLLSILQKLCQDFEFHVIFNAEEGSLSKEVKKLDNVRIIYADYSWVYAKNRTKLIKKLYRYCADFLAYYKNRGIDKALLNSLKNEEYDYIYTNTSVVDFGYLLSEKLSIPHIWHIREFGKEDFSFKRLCKRSYYENMFQKAEKLIFISHALEKNYLSKYSLNNNSKVVYNGFDIEELIYPKLNDIDSGEINIAIIGQVSQGKGQNQAIKACQLLSEKGYPIKLHVVGQVDEDFLKRTVPEYETYSWLLVHGQKNDIYNFRKSIDIELVCSTNEAFGRVCIEAMLHGIPVVGANTGGTAELIQHGETGLLYPLGDHNELSKNIECLIRDKGLYKNIQKKAQESAKQYSIDKTVAGVKNSFYGG
ncbi:glycosyltransferase family 4 protein [Streptococcus sp. zg-JUN1979]|uniref:glycosyltransferase family 4 protein n=1 Tax=Streptococcus sp. zg-JUN1979 TaxID=3391450 RepID=UPI0039A448F8